MGSESYWDWRTKGPCSTLSPRRYDKLFFPQSGRSIKEAQAFCHPCPVRELCLKFALETEADGIWAGTNKKERESILRIQRKARGQITISRPKVVKRVAIQFT